MVDLIRTGQAAELLGTSRQHVVDLVERGRLTRHGEGVHRRLDRAEVEALVGRPGSRDERQSLWLHRAVAGRIAVDPSRSLERARRNLRRIRQAHRNPSPWLTEWSRILADGPEEAMRALTSETPLAAELRQNSPFAGVLRASERRKALDAFQAWIARQSAEAQG